MIDNKNDVVEVAAKLARKWKYKCVSRIDIIVVSQDAKPTFICLVGGIAPTNQFAKDKYMPFPISFPLRSQHEPKVNVKGASPLRFVCLILLHNTSTSTMTENGANENLLMLNPLNLWRMLGLL